MSGIRLPPKSDPRWAALVSKGTAAPIKLLALKFMLTRMNQDVKRNPSPGTIAANVDELYAFFAKNPQMVGDDCSKLFG